jgi:PAS domain S-box-containing protein
VHLPGSSEAPRSRTTVDGRSTRLDATGSSRIDNGRFGPNLISGAMVLKTGMMPMKIVGPPRDCVEASCHIIFDSIEEGVFTVDLNWRITSFNRAAEKITGVSKKDALGKPCLEVFRTTVCQSDCVLRRAMRARKPVFNTPVYMLRPGAQSIPIVVNATVLKDETGRIIGGVETFRDLSSLSKLTTSFNHCHAFQDMISKNQKMLEIFSTVKMIADSDCTVLIEGATGTGKEMLAKAVHNTSAHRNGPFVPVNCGALPDSLIESELFGYKAGAFTDAKNDKPGRFERAHNGTIFLDEISDISQALQVRLLRVLEDRKYEPLGSVKPFPTNARVVVAANCNLDRLVEEKKFREDLYFRVNVMRLCLPPLAERKEDIPLLVDCFIDRMKQKQKKNVLGISQEAVAALILYHWPGNIRELENAIQRAYVICDSELIELRHLPERILSSVNPRGLAQGTTLREVEKITILQVLQHNNWKRAVTAEALGINKNTLRRKIVAYGLEEKVPRSTSCRQPKSRKKKKD